MYITNTELARQCNGTLAEGAPERTLRINTIHSAEPMDEEDGKGISVFFEIGGTGVYFDIHGTTIKHFTRVMNRLHYERAQEQ